MCYWKQQMVICFKTTENFGATWSIIFPARGSFATQVNKIYLVMHGSILPVTIPPPGNPRDKSSPSGPGVGNCLKRFCPGGRGAGQIENNFSFFL